MGSPYGFAPRTADRLPENSVIVFPSRLPLHALPWHGNGGARAFGASRPNRAQIGVLPIEGKQSFPVEQDEEKVHSHRDC